MTCREFADFLMEYLADDLPAVERVVFDEHLGECPDCVAYLSTYQHTIALTKTACGDDEVLPANVPEELVLAILAARHSGPRTSKD